MAKTTQIVGSSVSPTYLNNINGTNAGNGHLHTGLDADGSVPKIDLAAHVDGVLPYPNFAFNNGSLSLEGSVDGGSTYTVNFTVDVARCGVVASIKFGLDTPFVTASGGIPLYIQPVGGANWDSAIFGTQTSISTAFAFTSLISTAEALAAEYTNDSTPIAIYSSKFATFGSGVDIVMKRGAAIMFAINSSEA